MFSNSSSEKFRGMHTETLRAVSPEWMRFTFSGCIGTHAWSRQNSAFFCYCFSVVDIAVSLFLKDDNS